MSLLGLTVYHLVAYDMKRLDVIDISRSLTLDDDEKWLSICGLIHVVKTDLYETLFE